MLPSALALGWLISRLHQDKAAGEVMMVVYAILGCIAGFIVLERATKPYRLRLVDGVRSVFKIHFPNPAYTALVARKIGETDGHYKSPTPLQKVNP